MRHTLHKNPTYQLRNKDLTAIKATRRVDFQLAESCLSCQILALFDGVVSTLCLDWEVGFRHEVVWRWWNLTILESCDCEWERMGEGGGIDHVVRGGELLFSFVGCECESASMRWDFRNPYWGNALHGNASCDFSKVSNHLRYNFHITKSWSCKQEFCDLDPIIASRDSNQHFTKQLQKRTQAHTLLEKKFRVQFNLLSNICTLIWCMFD